MSELWRKLQRMRIKLDVDRTIGDLRRLGGIMLLLFLSAVPFLIAATYTLPVNDDISNALLWKDVVSTKGYWEVAFGQMKEIYMTWQGTYTGNLILYSLGVFYHWGVWGIRIFAVFNFLIFLGALFYLTYMVMTYVIGAKAWFQVGIVYGVLCVCFFGVRVHCEFFYFHTVACMYTIPISFGAISIGMALKEIMREKRSLRNKVFCIIFGILGCGGTLQIPAAICFVYLLLLIWSFFHRRERFKEALLIFLSVLAGALGNALAPGNFERQALMTLTKGGGFHVFQAVKYSVYMTMQEMYYIIKDTYFLFIFWIAFLCFYSKFLVYKVNKFNGPVGVLITVIVGSTITNFPMAIGRASTYMDNRGYSTLDLFLIIGLLFFLYASMNALKSKLQISFAKKDIFIFAMCLSVGFISYQEHMDLFSTPPFLCIEELKEGKIQQSAEEWLNVLEHLENSEESEIVLPYPQYNQSIIPIMTLEDWPEFWVNYDLAEYYQKDSIYYSENAEPIE